ncbi:hypothetical protein ACHAWF_014156 [Thalassiosira exigua]
MAQNVSKFQGTVVGPSRSRPFRRVSFTRALSPTAPVWTKNPATSTPADLQHDRGQASPPPGVMFQQVSSGGLFTCGLKAGGRIVCWGEIDHPPRSLESLSDKELPDFKHARRMQQEREGWTGASSRPVNGGDYYVQVSIGMRHACARFRGTMSRANFRSS